ncbi:preprotein translocase subunit SecE [Clostridium sp. MCC353]|uniref:preprotein translocase subunit SecE n=1 Tax=Clostridium sp. MCC353 TaxID=2592646 RepID=UPI001C01A114|nr:preprotein translocase subunit SecE [Clostridium sp. MCC353]MBS6644969.1 preprotein translocase subunit SecE [Clostridiaceae bacterium]MBT9776886.1 preprotein translocase subunit SecE [Clostridium sp. MCC353]
MGESGNAEKAPKASFFKGLKAEFNKIVWPDKETIYKQTAAVIAVSVALGLVIGVLDLIIKLGINFII